MKTIYATDEVGRGCLYGDVVTCTVKIKSEKDLEGLGIHDSKKLSSKKREKILELININICEIKKNKVYSYPSFDFCICTKNSKYIDQHNILKSTLHSMKESFIKLYTNEEDYTWFVDGDKNPDKSLNVQTIIKGDQKLLSIGLASIIAKEFRDEQMKKVSKKYPEYGFEKHKGSGTKLHREKIKELGALKNHRKSFLKKL